MHTLRSQVTTVLILLPQHTRNQSWLKCPHPLTHGDCHKTHAHTLRSQVSILKADADLYAASVDGKLVVKLGPSEWAPGPEDLGGKQPKLAVSGYQ